MSPQSAAGASAGVGALSSLFSGIGQYDAGQEQKAAYDYNAQIDLENTSSAIIANEQRYSAIVGKQAAAYAAAGVDITSGSPLLMMAATAGRGGAATTSSSTPPLSQQIRQLMEDCRLTAEELAEAIDLDPRNVYRHLAGKSGLRNSTIGAYEKFFSEKLGRHV